MYCYLLVSLCRNEAKTVSCNVVNYLLSSVNISHLPLCNYDAPISSQVRSTLDLAVWVQALAKNIVLCFLRTLKTVTVPLSGHPAPGCSKAGLR